MKNESRESTERLIAQVKAGQTGEFGVLVRRYQNAAFGYALSIVGNFHDAEDAAQDAFIQAYRCLGNLHAPAAFSGWLRSIVHAECHRILRKRTNSTSLDIVYAVESKLPGPLEQYVVREEDQQLLDTVNALPAPLREVISLYYLNEHSIAEVADFLGVPGTVVKNRLFRARQTLKRRMIPMDTTFKNRALTDEFAARIGKIVLVEGPIVEARFAPPDTPEVLTGLAPAKKGASNVVLQVVQKLGDGRVRAVAYGSVEGLAPGTELTPRTGESAPAITGEALRAMLAAAARKGRAEVRLVETGIKVIDLFCPLVDGGSAGLFGDPGVGKAAVIQEIVDRLGSRNESVTLIAFVEHLAEAERLAAMSDPIPAGAGGVDPAYVPVADASLSGAAPDDDLLDTAITFSAALAQAARWPAIDPLASRSAYLRSDDAPERIDESPKPPAPC